MIGLGRWIVSESVQQRIHCEMVTNFSAIFSATFDEYFVNLCKNTDRSNMDFQYINVCHIPHHHQDLANVNVWKTIFEPYIIANKAVPHAITYFLTSKNLCFNKEIHVLLFKGFTTFNTLFLGH